MRCQAATHNPSSVFRVLTAVHRILRAIQFDPQTCIAIQMEKYSKVLFTSCVLLEK